MMSIAYMEKHITPELEEQPNGCWFWTGAKLSNLRPVKLKRSKPNGFYGHLKFDGKYVLAHRVIYEAFNGPIPRGLEIDHLCSQSLCVNVCHLEAVTHAENMRRGAQAQGCQETAPVRHLPARAWSGPELKVQLSSLRQRQETRLCTRLQNPQA